MSDAYVWLWLLPFLFHYVPDPYAVDVVVLSAAAAAACPPVLLRLGRLRLGKGVVGSFGGTLTDSLSPNSVSFVTLRPNDQQKDSKGLKTYRRKVLRDRVRTI